MKIWSFFDRDDQFFALHMVNFSSLHDEGRPAEVYYQFHSIELVIALRMDVSWSILSRSYGYVGKYYFTLLSSKTMTTVAAGINNSMICCRRVVVGGGVAAQLLVLLLVALAPWSSLSFQNPNPNEHTIQQQQQQQQLKSSKHHKRSSSKSAGQSSQYPQMNEMLNHAILTKEEEIMYGQQVVDARSLRLQIEELVQEKRIHNAMLRRLENENKNENKDEEEKEEEIDDNDNDDTTTNEIDYNFLSYELEYLSVYGYRPTTTTTAINNTNEANVVVKRRNKFHTNNQKENEKEQDNEQSMSSPFEGYDYHDELLFEHVHHLNLHKRQQIKRRQGGTAHYDDDDEKYYENVVRRSEDPRWGMMI